MNVLDTIEMTKDQFTKADRAVYAVMSEDWVRVFRNSSNALASKYGLSQASVVRFCKRLGFEGYTDFRLALYSALQGPREEAAETEASKGECYKRLVDLIEGSAADGAFDGVADLLAGSRITITAGVHRSALPAQLLMLEMRLHDRISFYVPQDQQETVVSHYTPQDVFVLFSEAGDTWRGGLEQLSSLPAGERPTTVLVCMDARHPLRRHFDHVVWLPGSTNQRLPTRVDPSTVFGFFVDLLSACVAERIGNAE